METDELKLRELELKKIIKTAIKISEDTCIDAFKTKTLSCDLSMQRFVFQESFKLVLADLIKKKPQGTPSYNMEPVSELQQDF